MPDGLTSAFLRPSQVAELQVRRQGITVPPPLPPLPMSLVTTAVGGEQDAWKVVFERCAWKVVYERCAR